MPRFVGRAGQADAKLNPGRSANDAVASLRWFVPLLLLSASGGASALGLVPVNVPPLDLGEIPRLPSPEPVPLPPPDPEPGPRRAPPSERTCDVHAANGSISAKSPRPAARCGREEPHRPMQERRREGPLSLGVTTPDLGVPMLARSEPPVLAHIPPPEAAPPPDVATTSVRATQAPAPEERAGPTNAVAVAAAAGAGALLIPVWALYRRILRRHALEHETRRGILALLADRPALTTAQIARAMTVDRRTAAHHLDILHEFGLLSAERHGSRVLWYVPGTPTDPRALALRSEKARAVAQALAAEPGLTVRALAQRTGLARATAAWHAVRVRDVARAAPVASPATDPVPLV